MAPVRYRQMYRRGVPAPHLSDRCSSVNINQSVRKSLPNAHGSCPYTTDGTPAVHRCEQCQSVHIWPSGEYRKLDLIRLGPAQHRLTQLVPARCLAQTVNNSQSVHI